MTYTYTPKNEDRKLYCESCKNIFVYNYYELEYLEGDIHRKGKCSCGKEFFTAG